MAYNKDLQPVLEQISENNKLISDAVSGTREELSLVQIAAADALKGIKELKTKNDELANELSAEREARTRLEVKAQRFAGSMPAAPKNPGQQFTESAEYKAMVSRDPATPLVPMVYVETKSAISGDAMSTSLPGYFYQPQRLAEVVVPGLRKIHVRDVLNVIPTSAGAIDFIYEIPSTGYTNNAAMVAESGLKPNSMLHTDIQTVRAATLAHWIEVTRQVIMDAPQIQQYINTRLLYGLRLAEDLQLLYGNGTTQMLGIKNVPNIQTINAAGTTSLLGTVAPTALDIIRAAFAKAESSNYQPNAVVMNPIDWAVIETIKAGTAGLYVVGAIGGGGGSNFVNVGSPRELWGIPVVVTTAMNQGEFLTGAFDMAAGLYDREQAGIRISENVGTGFIQNKMTLLCEERLSLAVYRPDAFVWGTF